MEAGRINSCVIIGAGKVTTHLAKALADKVELLQIYSRTLRNASILAEKIDPHIPTTDNLDDILPDADLYLVSVSDDYIVDILRSTPQTKRGIWAHTSGSVPMDVFSGYKEDYGVFYPLQTFSKEKNLDVSSIPFLIEGSSPDVERQLLNLASSISRDVRSVDSEGRCKLHVAAVFACNFANYLWTQADEILRESGLDIKVLKPLLTETLAKISDISPRDSQTGPARRGDLSVIEKHITLLPPDKAEIYKFISDKIIKEYEND